MGVSGCARDSGRLVAAPFLVKAYRLVDDPSTDHIVSWGENSKSFVVWRPKEFSRSVLPSYFNHSNFSSFVRQLNTYGFRKIVRGRYEFANELFGKDQQHLLSHIQRRKPSGTSIVQASQIEYDNSSSVLFPPISSTQDSDVPAAGAASLSEENETLKKNNSFLLSEIARLQNICSNDIAVDRSTSWTDRPLIDTESSKIDNASGSSSMTDVADEISTSPPKLFGFPLY